MLIPISNWLFQFIKFYIFHSTSYVYLLVVMTFSFRSTKIHLFYVVPVFTNRLHEYSIHTSCASLFFPPFCWDNSSYPKSLATTHSTILFVVASFNFTLHFSGYVPFLFYSIFCIHLCISSVFQYVFFKNMQSLYMTKRKKKGINE